MDGMESLMGAFSGLPYFSPFSCINASGTCAASRILQTRWMGCSTGAPVALWVPMPRCRISHAADNDSWHAEFAVAPFFAPFTCAPSVVACRPVSVERKVRQEAAAPGPEQAAFRLKLAAIEAVQAAVRRSNLHDRMMVCVLWRWQVGGRVLLPGASWAGYGCMQGTHENPPLHAAALLATPRPCHPACVVPAFKMWDGQPPAPLPPPPLKHPNTA